MFHFDRGLKITSIDLAVDVCRRQPRGFISHAHADHIGAHELAFCTPPTAALYRHRRGAHRAVREMPFHHPVVLRDVKLTALPAGHILGAAMLLVEGDSQSLLYTGDFRLRPSLTAEQAAPPPADVLVMETTFGAPRFRFPDRAAVLDQLADLIEETFRDNASPVIRAYSLGKSQEVTRALTERGYSVMQHPQTYEISRIYEQFGCPLGDVAVYDRANCDRRVLVMPPRHQKRTYLPLPPRKKEIAVTGWAIDPQAKYRLGVDVALPISDHADFDELLECVEVVSPKRIYCTHGDPSFCETLQALGYDARILGAESFQTRLF